MYRGARARICSTSGSSMSVSRSRSATRSASTGMISSRTRCATTATSPDVRPMDHKLTAPRTTNGSSITVTPQRNRIRSELNKDQRLISPLHGQLHDEAIRRRARGYSERDAESDFRVFRNTPVQPRCRRQGVAATAAAGGSVQLTGRIEWMQRVYRRNVVEQLALAPAQLSLKHNMSITGCEGFRCGDARVDGNGLATMAGGEVELQRRGECERIGSGQKSVSYAQAEFSKASVLSWFVGKHLVGVGRLHLQTIRHAIFDLPTHVGAATVPLGKVHGQRRLPFPPVLGMDTVGDEKFLDRLRQLLVVVGKGAAGAREGQPHKADADHRQRCHRSPARCATAVPEFLGLITLRVVLRDARRVRPLRYAADFIDSPK